MIQANIQLAPEGKPIIFFAAFVALVSGLLNFASLAIIALLFCAFSIYFFRDPERVVPQEEDVAVSPADGRIILVENRSDPLNQEEHCCISIFMNVFNVHVNRVPVACTIEELKYIPGKFFNASFDKASKENERCVWKIRQDTGEHWYMVQIAGLIARRIVCRAEVHDQLKRGERCGMIRFGSRVDLYLPSSYAPMVKVGDIVFAGQSCIAKRQA